THLLKRLHLLEDREGHRCELRYVRDKDGHEVDFAVLRDGKLHELVEAKLSDGSVAPALRFFAEKLRPTRAIQVVGAASTKGSRHGDLSVVSVLDEFAKL
ncbi:MAG TPA: hypothetical protein VHM19_18660, partial [Polyangiales bacterium]|nr:hypothetical protein [Polyangiales bacterium]